jgi:hypothetical protein
MNIYRGVVWKADDKPVIIRFNYTLHRDSFNVSLKENGKIT